MSDWSRETANVPFLVLSLEIPPTPLFKDSTGGNVIPQVPLFDVLSKYNGTKYTDILKAGYQQRKRYSLLQLPPFIIFHLSRFTKVRTISTFSTVCCPTQALPRFLLESFLFVCLFAILEQFLRGKEPHHRDVSGEESRVARVHQDRWGHHLPEVRVGSGCTRTLRVPIGNI
jgi:hypothetical protein